MAATGSLASFDWTNSRASAIGTGWAPNDAGELHGKADGDGHRTPLRLVLSSSCNPGGTSLGLWGCLPAPLLHCRVLHGPHSSGSLPSTLEALSVVIHDVILRAPTRR